MLLFAGFQVWVWFGLDVQRQDKIMRSLGAGFLAVVLVVLWWLLYSRTRWKPRLGVFALVLVVGVGVGSLFRFRTVTGDLMPVLEPRWRQSSVTAVTDTNLLASAPGFVLADFPQFLGPDRRVNLAGIELSRDWHQQPPRQLWRRPVGAGWSGFAVAGKAAVTLEQDGDNEVVACYDLLTGEPRWRHAYAARYDTPVGGLGPRTVPTIVGDRVVTLGATGVLNCFTLAGGRPLWTVDILAENGASVPDWGLAGSPLVHEGRVIVSAGGSDGRSLVAYDLGTGARHWSGGGARAGYSAPTLGVLDGFEQVLIFNQNAVAAHDPADGRVLWEYPWGKGQPHVALPIVVSSNTLFVSSGYGIGAELLEVRRDAAGKWSAEQVWRSIRMKAKFTNVARRGDFIYGLDDGMLACLDLNDGSQRWKEGRYGHGQMIMVDGLVILTAEDGGIVLLEPTPDAPNELARIEAFDHKQWNPPALAGQLLLVRTDREAACYRLPLLQNPGR
ncbi:MAG TPA: hypothetical protein DCY13_11695 [Verrucomicrobiales bacterium]|nr:hypothetical protein [Verrucomicrobiales bacterium]